MENEKKAYEPIEIIKVEFDVSDRITNSGYSCKASIDLYGCYDVNNE